MYRLFGFSTQNTMKTLYTLEELGVDYEFQFVDLFKGEHRKEAFAKLNPFTKFPVLQHDDRNLFESGAICRYLANIENSELYPKDKFQRALVDQWMDFFSCHLGRYLSGLFYETIIVAKTKSREPNENYIAEATGFIKKYFPVVNMHLNDNKYFVGDGLTIADLFAFAYIEQLKVLDIPLSDYPNIHRWLNEIESRDSIQKGQLRIKNGKLD